jgi:hypothetical protein
MEISRGTINDIEEITGFQIAMALESEGTILDGNKVRSGVKAAMEDENITYVALLKMSDVLPVIQGKGTVSGITVKGCKRLYLLGRQSSETRDVLDSENGGSKGVTGGENQKNPADYIELLAAFAAYNFFKEAYKPEPFEDGNGERFLCLSHDYGTNKLDFRLFAQEDEEVFKKKLGAFTVASLLNLKGTEFFANIVNERNMFESVNANGVEMDSLREYLALYNVGLDQNDNVVRGWLPQMNAGRGGQGIFFNDALFRCETLKELNKFKYNSQLFVGDNPPKFDVGFLSNIFSTVKNKFVATDAEKRNNFDDLLSRTYSTIMNLYFND